MTKSTKYRRMGKGSVSNVLRREIRAARLKVILDKELGRTTEPEVQLLAEMDLPPINRMRPADAVSHDQHMTAS